MRRPDSVRETPWDKKVFGLDTFDVLVFDEDACAFVQAMAGHFTIKVDPLADCRPLLESGFYYCDTLIEPFVTTDTINYHDDRRAGICKASMEELAPICLHAFDHGRFHRDPHLDRDAADFRYIQWLTQMHNEDGVLGLTWEGRLAAFFACRENRILLHAVADAFRGKGLAKYLWSAGLRELFSRYEELSSSISAANLAALNLYASLGFRFRTAVDVYHRLTP